MRCWKRLWRIGGANFIGTIADTIDESTETNRIVADFVRDKIRGVVKDRATADALCPTSHPIGTKRHCVDSNYYETYNRPNVKLVNLQRESHRAASRTNGIRMADGTLHELDTLVLATGFDAMTGALLRIDVRGSGGVSLAEK